LYPNYPWKKFEVFSTIKRFFTFYHGTTIQEYAFEFGPFQTWLKVSPFKFLDPPTAESYKKYIRVGKIFSAQDQPLFRIKKYSWRNYFGNLKEYLSENLYNDQEYLIPILRQYTCPSFTEKYRARSGLYNWRLNSPINMAKLTTYPG